MCAVGVPKGCGHPSVCWWCWLGVHAKCHIQEGLGRVWRGVAMGLHGGEESRQAGVGVNGGIGDRMSLRA